MGTDHDHSAEHSHGLDTTPNINEVLAAMDSLERMAWDRAVERARSIKQTQIIQAQEQALHEAYQQQDTEKKAAKA